LFILKGYRVVVKFFAYIRDFTGCKETDFPYEKDISDLACALCAKYGEKLREKMLSPAGDELGPDIIIMINGRHVAHLGGIKAPLKPDDKVYIFPMVAGG
jgi:molybdopterin synthase sulfur carrier subunit